MFHAYFASQETQKVNLYYITRNENWVEMLKLKLLIFVENLFSYKFDQPCFSIFLLIFKALCHIQTFVSHIILHEILRSVYQNLS
jgi:hypothetical protein